MCGIFGIVTAEEQDLGPILIDAGRRLSYRGYDSVGCATLGGASAIDLRKDVGKIDEVAQRYHMSEMTGRRGIVQLRWATFGQPTRENAQPHLDSDGDLVGAHNGNVVNNFELRREFMRLGMTVRSTNDGETCVHAVERYLDQGLDFVDSLRCAYQDLEGDYAFVIGSINDDRLFAVKKGSGLVAGLGEGFTCVSSDLPSILPLTRRILRLQDGEIVTLWPNRVEIRSLTDGTLIEREAEIITESMDVAQKGGYPHFMLKEIHEQPQVARELLHLLDSYPDMDSILERISHARHLYLVGCGTSFNASMLGAVYLARLAGIPAVPVLAPQFAAQYGPTLGPQDVGIFVSQSGETKDVLNAVELAHTRGAQVVSLVNVIGSSLMQTSQAYMPLACGYEISVPATKTFTNQVIAFLYLATRLGGHPTHSLNQLPEMMQAAIESSLAQVEALEKPLAESIHAAGDDLYCLGYGLTYATALEGALKLKEITYAHCEGMLSTEFKHGPLSVVQENYPVLFVAGPQDVPLILSGINEVTCRGGRAVVIGEENERLRANAHDLITIPESDPNVNALLSVLPLQILSYRLSIARGYDPDFPRNLSKTLTVD
jgi:glucosamine--fructose-6-phosphate aminotransferase (isomerizing)